MDTNAVILDAVERVEQPSVLIERSIVRMRQLRSDGWKIG